MKLIKIFAVVLALAFTNTAFAQEAEECIKLDSLYNAAEEWNLSSPVLMPKEYNKLYAEFFNSLLSEGDELIDANDFKEVYSVMTSGAQTTYLVFYTKEGCETGFLYAPTGMLINYLENAQGL
jgi:hypothetical protein